LEAEGFYDSDHFNGDSEDEKAAADLVIAQKHKNLAQLNKKALRNKARLPRTAGLKTLSEFSQKMTEAGLDPSRVEERARIIAMARSNKSSRMISGDEMDVDGGVEAGADSGDVERRKMGLKPQSDRRLAGLRNAEARRSVAYMETFLSYFAANLKSGQTTKS
jgi:nucleolar GTP-binding protein